MKLHDIYPILAKRFKMSVEKIGWHLTELGNLLEDRIEMQMDRITPENYDLVLHELANYCYEQGMEPRETMALTAAMCTAMGRQIKLAEPFKEPVYDRTNEHRWWSWSEWRDDVRLGNTNLGYNEWVHHQMKASELPKLVSKEPGQKLQHFYFVTYQCLIPQSNGEPTISKRKGVITGHIQPVEPADNTILHLLQERERIIEGSEHLSIIQLRITPYSSLEEANYWYTSWRNMQD
jgi:hypothetical protein